MATLSGKINHLLHALIMLLKHKKQELPTARVLPVLGNIEEITPIQIN